VRAPGASSFECGLLLAGVDRCWIRPCVYAFRPLLILVALITAYSARDVQSTPGYRECPQIFRAKSPPPCRLSRA
jgi:hypothetical protein